MKKISTTLLTLAASLTSFGQSAIDAYNVTQTDLRGTARFMSMAGAFGALGGDLSTLTQNPAGIGVYRSSEIGVTVDFDFQSFNTGWGNKVSQTKVYCNNFGYVGAINLGGELLKTFNWGATYNRKASFDREYFGGFAGMPTSLTNYIGQSIGNVAPADLSEFGTLNPYDQPGTYWLGALAYNSGLVSPSTPSGANYVGLAAPGSNVDGYFNISERGYIDEYSINFGGNFIDMLYWGIGFGITDLKWTQWSTYGEDVFNANVPVSGSRVGNTSPYYSSGGEAYYDLNNWKQINGSGFNIKLGLIFKPIEQLRIGAAVHTPTWYTLNQNSDASVDFDYSSGFSGYFGDNYDELDYPSYLEYKLKSPWRFMISAAGVIGGRFILSADYEHDAYDSMTFGSSGMYRTDYSWINDDIKYYFQSANTIRIGAEFRVTPKFSVRAGYSYTGDNVKGDVYDPKWQADNLIYTSGAYDQQTNPAFTFNKSTQYITFGLGYKFGSFYLDAAYVHKSRDSYYQPFTSFYNEYNQLMATPQAKLSQNDNNLVLSLGFRF